MDILNLRDDRAGSAPAELIKDTTTAEFVADVIEASRFVPVLVDFWAPWCGPCRQLGPILEKVIKSTGGAVRLVKMNIDEHPEIPGQLGVQSIPAVFAFKDGRPVDGFMGALPESQIRAFITRVAGTEAFAGGSIEEAEAALAAGDIQGAAGLFAEALRRDKEDVAAIAGLAKCYIKMGDLDRAEQTLAMLPAAKRSAAAVASAQAMLDLARKSAQGGDAAALQERIAAHPDDLQARFDLAMALHAQGQREAAMDQLLEIIRRDREWNDGAARKQLIQFFDAWGPKDALTTKGRQRLSTILFA